MKDKKILIVVGAIALIFVLCLCISIPSALFLMNSDEESSEESYDKNRDTDSEEEKEASKDEKNLTIEEKFLREFNEGNSSVPAGWELYEHSVDCSQYNSSLIINSFSLAYPDNFDLENCAENRSNYISLYDMNDEDPDYDSISPEIDMNFGFGYFNLDEIKYDYYQRLNEDFTDEFAEDLRSNLPQDADLIFVSEEPLKLENGLMIEKKDYELTVGSYFGGFAEGTYHFSVILIPNFDSGNGMLLLAAVHEDEMSLDELHEDYVSPMIESITFK